MASLQRHERLGDAVDEQTMLADGREHSED